MTSRSSESSSTSSTGSTSIVQHAGKRGGDLCASVLMGEGPFVKDRDLCPFVARQSGKVVARVLALVDSPTSTLERTPEPPGLVRGYAGDARGRATDDGRSVRLALPTERPCCADGGPDRPVRHAVRHRHLRRPAPKFLRQNPAYTTGSSSGRGSRRRRVSSTTSLKSRRHSRRGGAAPSKPLGGRVFKSFLCARSRLTGAFTTSLTP